MAGDTGFSSVARPLRLFLFLAALDSLIVGCWVVAQPTDLFTWLALTPNRDSLLLSRALGALTLAHVPCLLLAALQPRSWSGLVIVPLLGRSLLACVWLWLLHSARLHPATVALHWLLGHELLFLPLFGAVLWNAARTTKHA